MCNASDLRLKCTWQDIKINIFQQAKRKTKEKLDMIFHKTRLQSCSSAQLCFLRKGKKWIQSINQKWSHTPWSINDFFWHISANRSEKYKILVRSLSHFQKSIKWKFGIILKRHQMSTNQPSVLGQCPKTNFWLQWFKVQI